jgi:starvation-inducible DNA-binding protein
MASTLFRTHHDLPAKVRAQVVPILVQHLADTTDLFTQVKTAHWNVKGPHFIALHELFDKLAEELEDQADTLAERATALGGLVAGSLRQAASATRLPDWPADATEGNAVVRALVERYAHLAKATRAAIAETTKLDDAGTADLFTGVSRELDKSMWFLEAHEQSSR